MIVIKNVTKKYEEFIALDNVSLEINKGEILVLLGPSGSGKSTLIRAINKMVPIESGFITIFSKDIKDIDSVVLRRSIGYVIQSIGLFPHMNGYDNIASVPRLLGWEESRIKDRVEELISLANLNEALLKKKPSKLSGGEAQRIGVLRALAADPEILLMDEPFGLVDPVIRVKLQNEFFSLQRKMKKTVIFVTHDIGEAITLGDKIAVINNGKILACDEPINLIKTEDSFLKEFLNSEYIIEYLSKIKAGDYFEQFKDTELTMKDYFAKLLVDRSINENKFIRFISVFRGLING
jgi:osmoprotectant transport system ATP-binding protein